MYCVCCLLFGGVMLVCSSALLRRRHSYAACHQMVELFWGYLGKVNRVPLPSCAVLGIRDDYPFQDYEGFHGSARVTGHHPWV